MSNVSIKPNVDVSQLQEIVKRAQHKYSSLRKEKSQDTYCESYQISVVTPMFGGGREPGNVDSVPIRSASVRGHLRFWWRATRGAQYKTVAELYEREAAIFGDTKQPSKVKIWVEVANYSRSASPITDSINRLNKTPVRKLKSNLKAYSYALFPFSSSEKFYYPTCEFKLFIDYGITSVVASKSEEHLSDLKIELGAALWAWVNFGGIGARTRRGCGSLYESELSPKEPFQTKNDVKAWLQANLTKYQISLLPETECRDWTTLSGKIELNVSRASTNVAWKQILEAYQHFRRRANRQEERTPGRSHWPEADSIRRLTNMAEPNHKTPLTILETGGDIAFPKAQFGLPIITKFKNDSKKLGDEREPYTTQLVPKDKTRLASPLITKSIAVSNTEGYGAVIVLNQPKITELELGIPDKDKEADKDINKRHASRVKNTLKSAVINENHIYPNLTYKDQSKNPLFKDGTLYQSAIDAFLASEEVHNWKEGIKQGNQNYSNNQTKRR